MKVKQSYGIALCRKNENHIEIVMVKKRFTYQFSSFVMGRYNKNDLSGISNMLSNMTFQEKKLINEHQFRKMWLTLWPDAERRTFAQTRGYLSKKNKFGQLIEDAKGKTIKNLIEHSTNSETMWEVPKGRKNRRKTTETDYDTAIREFKEETNIDPENYRIFWHEPSIVESYVDNKTRYINHYFLATPLDLKKWNPKVSFNNEDQLLEVDCVKYVKYSEIEFMLMGKSTETRIKQIFKTIANRFRLKVAP